MARKTKAPVDYQTGTPQVGDGVIWNGHEWVLVKIHLWEETSNKLFHKNAGAVVFGKDETTYETVIEPRSDVRKDIGSSSARFRDLYINKAIVHGEITLKVGEVIKWIITPGGDDLVFKNSAGQVKLKMLSNGDMEFFK